MSAVVLTALVTVSGLSAGLLVRAYGARSSSRSLWWLATISAVGAALSTHSGGASLAVACAGTGLAAAAVIDAVERRIPASLAHGTTAVSGLALAGHAWRTSSWDVLSTAAILTTAVVAMFGVAWLAGGMGFGDVRLAASTVTASVTAAGTLTFLWGACAAVGVTAIVCRSGPARRRAEVSPGAGEAGDAGSRATVPFAPAIAAGWLLSVATA